MPLKSLGTTVLAIAVLVSTQATDFSATITPLTRTDLNTITQTLASTDVDVETTQASGVTTRLDTVVKPADDVVTATDTQLVAPDTVLNTANATNTAVLGAVVTRSQTETESVDPILTTMAKDTLTATLGSVQAANTLTEIFPGSVTITRTVAGKPGKTETVTLSTMISRTRRPKTKTKTVTSPPAISTASSESASQTVTVTSISISSGTPVTTTIIQELPVTSLGTETITKSGSTFTSVVTSAGEGSTRTLTQEVPVTYSTVETITESGSTFTSTITSVSEVSTATVTQEMPTTVASTETATQPASTVTEPPVAITMQQPAETDSISITLLASTETITSPVTETTISTFRKFGRVTTTTVTEISVATTEVEHPFTIVKPLPFNHTVIEPGVTITVSPEPFTRTLVDTTTLSGSVIESTVTQTVTPVAPVIVFNNTQKETVAMDGPTMDHTIITEVMKTLTPEPSLMTTTETITQANGTSERVVTETVSAPPSLVTQSITFTQPSNSSNATVMMPPLTVTQQVPGPTESIYLTKTVPCWYCIGGSKTITSAMNYSEPNAWTSTVLSTISCKGDMTTAISIVSGTASTTSGLAPCSRILTSITIISVQPEVTSTKGYPVSHKPESSAVPYSNSTSSRPNITRTVQILSTSTSTYTCYNCPMTTALPASLVWQMPKGPVSVTVTEVVTFTTRLCRFCPIWTTSSTTCSTLPVPATTPSAAGPTVTIARHTLATPAQQYTIPADTPTRQSASTSSTSCSSTTSMVAGVPPSKSQSTVTHTYGSPAVFSASSQVLAVKSTQSKSGVLSQSTTAPQPSIIASSPAQLPASSHEAPGSKSAAPSMYSTQKPNTMPPVVATTTPVSSAVSMPVASQFTDGQVIAPTGSSVASSIPVGHGQGAIPVPSPNTQTAPPSALSSAGTPVMPIPDGQVIAPSVSAMTPASSSGTGQSQAPDTEVAVPQTTAGFTQAQTSYQPTAAPSAAIIMQISDGQVNVPASASEDDSGNQSLSTVTASSPASGTPVMQLSDGQVIAPTQVSPTGGAIDMSIMPSSPPSAGAPSSPTAATIPSGNSNEPPPTSTAKPTTSSTSDNAPPQTTESESNGAASSSLGRKATFVLAAVLAQIAFLML